MLGFHSQHTTQSLGDLVRPPCIVLDITSFVTMTCRVNNNTNKVAMRFSASECYLNFTAEKGGLLELSCDVFCTQGVITYNTSWAVVGKYMYMYIHVSLIFILCHKYVIQTQSTTGGCWSAHIPCAYVCIYIHVSM